jgi:chromate transporter
VIRIGRRALRTRTLAACAVAAFIGIFLFEVPFPLIVGAAALAGFLGSRLRPAAVPPVGAHASPGSETGAGIAHGDGVAAAAAPSWRSGARTAVLFLLLWWTPVLLLALLFGTDSIWVREGVFFSQAAVVTFGGAYAVLAYIAQNAVDTYGWLQPGEMLDGLGMAETTPGPLIMVVQFVGFMGAYRNAGALDPMLAGVLGSVLTTWVTFVPCFLFIFVGAPWIQHLRGRRGLSAALSGITAAVVGVILNLALWFSIHVLFGDVAELRTAGMRILVPDPATLDVAALLIALGACVAIFVLKWGVLRTLGAAALAGVAWGILFSP